jgi:hypothetical protein
VSDQQPGAIPEAGTDLEYDLAHEASGVTTPVSPHNREHPEAVVTATPEYDGDYSYDLAHDVPR